MRDNQKSAVYKWEREFFGSEWEATKTNFLTLDECQILINRVWKDYGRLSSPPFVKDGRGTRVARGSLVYINLPRWARTKPIVLHEIAHALLSWHRVAGHGPEFATLVVQLWVRYLGASSKELRQTGINQKPRRVHFAPVAEVDKLSGRANLLAGEN